MYEIPDVPGRDVESEYSGLNIAVCSAVRNNRSMFPQSHLPRIYPRQPLSALVVGQSCSSVTRTVHTLYFPDMLCWWDQPRTID